MTPVRVHPPRHINILRCSGQVDAVMEIPSFGPADEDFAAALRTLDR